MNDFDGLLPPRVTPPPLPRRGGPVAAFTQARARRRSKATKVAGATSALTLAFAGLVFLRPPAPTHGIVLDPDTTPTPTYATRTPSPSPTVRPGPGEPAGVGSGTPLPGRTDGTRSPAPVPSPTAVPSAPGHPSPPASPAYTRIDRTFVADPSPGEDCTTETTNGLDGNLAVYCTRTIAPEAVRTGKPARFVFQACASDMDQTVTFKGTAEAEEWIMPADESRQVWVSDAPPGGDPHDLVIPAGQCVQYTIHWTGLDDTGSPLPPGDYLAVSRFFDHGGPWEISDDPFRIVP